MDIGCCQVFKYLHVNLCSGSFKSAGTVILAVCSREYRNKHTGLCNLMIADINSVCMEQSVFINGSLFMILRCCKICSSSVIFTGICFKHFFQSSCPCLHSLFQRNFSISVRELRISSNFTDHCIGNGKTSHFVSRNLKYQITKSRSKEVSWVKIVLDLNAKAVSKCHFCNCSSQSVTVKSICGKNASLLHILVKFSVLVHNALIIRKLICILWRTKPYKPASCFF